MTIYDLKLYGACLPRLAGEYKVALVENMEVLYGKVPRDGQFVFEVTVLKEYGSKQDVLQLQFKDGHKEYMTLYEPAMYLESGEWRQAKSRNVAESFLEKYEELKEMKMIGQNPNIFDLNFYGLQEEIGFGIKRVEVFLSRVKRDVCLKHNSLSFKAVVVKEYKNKKFVIRAVTSEGEICHVPLFDANIYYDEERKKWDYCHESPIPAKILKCYVEHLNG